MAFILISIENFISIKMVVLTFSDLLFIFIKIIQIGAAGCACLLIFLKLWKIYLSLIYSVHKTFDEQDMSTIANM